MYGIPDPVSPGSVVSSPASRLARTRAGRRRASLARRGRLAPIASAPVSSAQRAPRAAGSPQLTDVEIERRLERLARVLVRTMRSAPMPGVAPLRRRDWLLIAGIVVAEALIVLLFAWAGR